MALEGLVNNKFTRSLRQAIRDAVLVSENARIEVAGDEFRISAVGDIGSAYSTWERGSDELRDLMSEEARVPPSPSAT